MKVTSDRVVGAVVILCFAFGIVLGCVGLGGALVVLPVRQSIGVGILSFGAGAVFGMVFGAKRIMRSVIDTCREIQADDSKAKER